MPERVVLYDRRENVGIITLNRPDHLNAINLNAGSTLNTQDSMGLGGNISGAGSLTVATGTLSLFGNSYSIWSGATTVAATAAAGTAGGEK